MHTLYLLVHCLRVSQMLFSVMRKTQDYPKHSQEMNCHEFLWGMLTLH